MKTKLDQKKGPSSVATIILKNKNKILLVFALLLFPKVAAEDSISSGESLARFSYWMPFCCMTMISPNHSTPIHICSTIDYFWQYYKEKTEDVIDFADRIDANEIFTVTDEQYETERPKDLVPDLGIDSIFALNSLDTVIHKYFVFKNGHWFLKQIYNSQGQVVIFDNSRGARSDDVVQSEFNEYYLFYCLQKWHYYCCLHNHANLILAPHPSIKIVKEIVEMR